MRVELKYQGDKQRMSEKNILEEIAEKTGRERKSVENAICRIRSKIRKLYNEKSHGAD